MSENVEHYPSLDPDRQQVISKVHEVTLLEDRAQVQRRAKVTVEAGQARLMVPDVAPVIQDVSVRAKVLSGPGRVTDAAVRRAIRIKREDKPEDVRELDAKIRQLQEDFQAASELRQRAESRYDVVLDMLSKGITEIPEDAAWGLVEEEAWSQTFSTLFERARALQEQAQEQVFVQEDLAEQIERATRQRQLMDRPDQHFVAWIEVDVLAQEGGELEIAIDYVVPNAMWRPTHSARLQDSKLIFTCQAAVWQNTGEDWVDTNLIFSTARSSLGVEPPLLSDDLLTVQRKREDVQVEMREVAVQRASVDGAPRPGGGKPAGPQAVDLPGVDDGGDIQNLRPEGAATLPSDGRPYFLELFTFESEANTSLVLMPELSTKVFLKSVQNNTSSRPILAGPVELIRDSGVVGQTETLFVAAGESFELGFGPQEELRVTRHAREVSAKRDVIDKWMRHVHQIDLFLSNLGDEPRKVEVTERIPVAEIEHVKVELLEKDTSGKRPPDKGTTGDPEVDENGFVRWTVELGAYERGEINLRWQLALAPDVTSK